MIIRRTKKKMLFLKLQDKHKLRSNITKTDNAEFTQRILETSI